ncbi:MAG: PEP/pyruvate-binding domain-containing protein [Planctomycetaceae bacterium]|nr:PEP/pyruvate-binding domain-containing protein [Planctomycetaceae bacterium]
MPQTDANLGTGLAGFDKVLGGLIPGDNIVFHVDTVENYRPFIAPCCQAAHRSGRKLIYFRFAKHPPLLGDDAGADVYELKPEEGFEAFLAAIHRVVEQHGHGSYFIFDCLSDLAADWYSDQMLGNFFLLTCPYLYDVEAIAYFGLLRNCHAAETTATIAETAQVVINIYRHNGELYIHPQKVQQRFSPTMYFLHVWHGDDFLPVTQSAVISEILTAVPWRRLASSAEGSGLWGRSFREAAETMEAVAKGEAPPEREREIFRRLVYMMVTRNDRLFDLVEKYMTLAEIIRLGGRMLGTGLIGGKSVGMLIARAVLRRSTPHLAALLEPHDSFYIGSDVFYTFLVRNGIWWIRQRQKDPQSFLDGAERARQSIIRGSFGPETQKQFSDMLDYFGQSPIIVRSSSLQEDSFGNAFAGKYESVFCVNQGSRDKRLEDFMSAVRTIYASTMSEKALRYRAQRGLLDSDEQMALLVQRVSGSLNGQLFYPHVAGVGFSINPYVWNEEIDPNAGMLRLVFGLGTRAVDRVDDDYTRVVALNAPQMRPEGTFDEVRQYAQRRVDVLNLQSNQLISSSFPQVVAQGVSLPIETVASAAASPAPDAPPDWVLTFEKLLSATDFVDDMRNLFQVLHRAYAYPVDVEFTANFIDPEHYKINLVQCRPLQVQGAGTIVAPPDHIPDEQLVLRTKGAVIGPSRLLSVSRIIFICPFEYGRLPIADRHSVARLIGKVMHAGDRPHHTSDLLIGPGRWGTTTPSLGIPTAFADINNAAALCEVVAMREDLIPSASLGTHYFSDLVENDILYFTLLPNQDGNVLNETFLRSCPNALEQIVPNCGPLGEIVRVIDFPDNDILLYANNLKQQVVCHRSPRAQGRGVRD